MTELPSLDAKDKAALLGIARASLRERLELGPPPSLPDAGPLAEPRGAFVTLRIAGRLRGCVGTFSPKGSLAATVARMAVAAATDDPRFPPVSAEELDDVDVHVSVLGPLRRIRHAAEVRIGRDGVLVQLGWSRGALLPTVAVEAGWDAATFLERTCIKAGLPPRAWQDPHALVELFPTEEVGGEGDA